MGMFKVCPFRVWLGNQAAAAALRSQRDMHPLKKEVWIPINSGYGPDLGGPQKRNFSYGSPRTQVAHSGKTHQICRISAVVAPIGLKFCVCA